MHPSFEVFVSHHLDSFSDLIIKFAKTANKNIHHKSICFLQCKCKTKYQKVQFKSKSKKKNHILDWNFFASPSKALKKKYFFYLEKAQFLKILHYSEKRVISWYTLGHKQTSAYKEMANGSSEIIEEGFIWAYLAAVHRHVQNACSWGGSKGQSFRLPSLPSGYTLKLHLLPQI